MRVCPKELISDFKCSLVKKTAVDLPYPSVPTLTCILYTTYIYIYPTLLYPISYRTLHTYPNHNHIPLYHA